MALFQFEYFSGETPQAQWLFYHESRSAEEFRADCRRALNDVGDEYIDSRTGLDNPVCGYDWFKEAVKKLHEWGYVLVNVPKCRLWLPSIIYEYTKDQCSAISQRLFRKAVEKHYEFELAYYGEEVGIKPPSWIKGEA